MLKLGSLFDGSGGFPLAGVLHGVEPVWASEIEPYPVRVTTARFPAMKHLGDVTKIDGAAIEPVDIITFGSPCQDLSVAGKGAGLQDGTRSNLFYEAIRIIKEMRNDTENLYPRIAIWENVPGAFSSNKGADFQAVLQAFCEIADPAAYVPMPPKKWHKSGAVVGDGWSVAWRTFDAQFWGVPQRRKRIYLIADFGSERAGEILFEQEGVRGHSTESGTAREGAAGDAEGSAGRSSYGVTTKGNGDAFISAERHTSLTVGGGQAGQGYPCVLECNDDQKTIVFKERAGCPGGGKGILCGDKPFTLSTLTDQAVCYAAGFKYGNSAQAHGIGWQDEVSPTLQAGEGGNQKPVVCYALQGNGIDRADTAGCNGAVLYTKQAIGHYCELKVASTQQARQYKSADDLVVSSAKPPRKYIIRRLTPLECLRLQGLPDGWLDGVDGSDSAKYKMLGNGIAMPNAIYVVGCAVQLLQEGKHENEG